MAARHQRETSRHLRGGVARSGVLLAVVLGVATPAAPIQWVTVGAASNPPDDEVSCKGGDPGVPCRTNLGSVPIVYRISKHEITNAEYGEFLNAVAAADPNDLFNPFMQAPPDGLPGTIVRLGSSGSYTYSVVPGFENNPVRYTSFGQAVRFANWLHNGAPVGAQDETTTEDGAYLLVGVALADVQRDPEAEYWIPSEDEWYKAAFYDPFLPRPDGSGQLGWYHDYATRSDVPPAGEVPPGSANAANLCPNATPASCLPGSSAGPDEPTDVGAYTGSPGPWGTHDQAGNLWEWTEDRAVLEGGGVVAVIHGSYFGRGTADSAAFYRSGAPLTCAGCGGIGIRVARLRARRGCGLGYEVALVLLLWRVPRRPVQQTAKLIAAAA